MCDFVKTKAHWNFSMLFSKILDQKIPSGEITGISNWRRILDIYREPLLYIFMIIARERTTIEKRNGSSTDSVEKMDHMAMSTKNLSKKLSELGCGHDNGALYFVEDETGN